MVLRKLIVSVFFIFLANTVYADELILGFYGFAVKTDIDIISDSSFKYLMPYGMEGNKNTAFLEDYLNYAEEKGVKIIFSLKDVYRESRWYPKTKWCPYKDESKLIECIIKRFGDYKSVYGWYMADEPTDSLGIGKRAKLERNAKAIKKFSSKPIFINDQPFPRGKMWDYISGFSDVLMTHSYPVPEDPLTNIYWALKELTVSYDKPVIAVVQAHGKYQHPFYKRDLITGRPPTYQEIKVMSYLSLVAGAEGILYFALSDIKKLSDSHQRLNFLKKLGDELKTDYQIISSKEKTLKDYKLNKDDEVYAILRHYNDKDYLIAVNSTNIEKNIYITQLMDKEITKQIRLTPLDVKVMPLEKSFNHTLKSNNAKSRKTKNKKL